MAQWQKELRILAKDFYIPKTIYISIINNTKRLYECADIPKIYKGNRNRFMYDMAHKELKQYLFKVL